MLPQDIIHEINDSLPSFGRSDVVLFSYTKYDTSVSLPPIRIPQLRVWSATYFNEDPLRSGRRHDGRRYPFALHFLFSLADDSFGRRNDGKQLDELIPFLGVTKRFRKNISGLQDRCDVYEYEMPSTKLLSKPRQIETLGLVRMAGDRPDSSILMVA